MFCLFIEKGFESKRGREKEKRKKKKKKYEIMIYAEFIN